MNLGSLTCIALDLSLRGLPLFVSLILLFDWWLLVLWYPRFARAVRTSAALLLLLLLPILSALLELGAPPGVVVMTMSNNLYVGSFTGGIVIYVAYHLKLKRHLFFLWRSTSATKISPVAIIIKFEQERQQHEFAKQTSSAFLCVTMFWASICKLLMSFSSMATRSLIDVPKWSIDITRRLEEYFCARTTARRGTIPTLTVYTHPLGVVFVQSVSLQRIIISVKSWVNKNTTAATHKSLFNIPFDQQIRFFLTWQGQLFLERVDLFLKHSWNQWTWI